MPCKAYCAASVCDYYNEHKGDSAYGLVGISSPKSLSSSVTCDPHSRPRFEGDVAATSAPLALWTDRDVQPSHIARRSRNYAIYFQYWA